MQRTYKLLPSEIPWLEALILNNSANSLADILINYVILQNYVILHSRCCCLVTK